MAKKLVAKLKLQCPGGQAVPNQTIAPALGQHNVNIGEFIKRFNEGTRDQMGTTIPVIVSVFIDKTFELEFKKPPAATLICKALGIPNGSGTPGPMHPSIATMTRAQVRDVAQIKMSDLNAGSIEAAERIIAGTARSMGIAVE
ncbi:MAG: 50S ribosomal protein L11 [Planctomycetota bacterium]